MSQRYYSNVYWHFTGSPANLDGHLVTRPEDIRRLGTLKGVDESIDILLRILRSRQLLATSVEMIAENLRTRPFCCVTDIPLKDLAVHALNYGKVAVGFRAPAIHHSFLPVIYLSKDNALMRDKLIPFAANGYRLSRQNGEIAEPSGEAPENPFLDFIKITEFGSEPGMTFYSEREWRHVGDYEFNESDIEAVIAPADKLPYLRECLFDQLGYSTSLSLIAWEFLENA